MCDVFAFRVNLLLDDDNISLFVILLPYLQAFANIYALYTFISLFITYADPSIL